MINQLRLAVAVALAAAAGPAAALGLGQLQVKSRIDQPLVAEIQVISSDRTELEQLTARLASPATFRRVGLEPPSGAAADLQFSLGVDNRGDPVIRVTSSAPVSQPLVTFLVEVDWGSGRLVREYSALLETPRTVSAPAQPPIAAPVVAPPPVIARQPDLPAAAPEAPAPGEAAPVARDTGFAAAPVPTRAPAPTPTARPAAPADLTPARDVAGNVLTVAKGQTLGAIASEVAPRGYSLDQAMLALLRANPDAFIRGNINLLKAGAVLRVPNADEVAELGAAEAAALVHDQVTQWRAMRKPAPQPAAIAAAGAPAAPAAAGRAARAQASEARLQIVPPEGGNRPGTRSGASAGGEGDMLRQEMQQAREDLAARTAEVDELKTRVAELEKLQQQQQALLRMKDSALASAEQRLADARKAGETTPAPTASASAPLWPWLGGGLLLLGLLAWVFTRRRAAPVRVSRRYDTEALVAGMPRGMDLDAAAAPEGDGPAATVDDIDDQEVEDGIPARGVAAAAVAAAPVGPAPTWHAGGTGQAPGEAPGAAQQLDLARAYLDLGDDAAARVLLTEVLHGRDPAARDTAARLLRDL